MADSTIHGLTALTGANVVPASDELAIWDDDAAITKRITINEVKSAIGLPALGVYAVGDILYASSTSALARLADVAVGSVLVSGGIGTAPAWSAAPTLTTSITVPLILAPAAALAIRPTTDGVTAIQLQDKDGNSILNVDTTNNFIGIGTAAPLNALSVVGSVSIGSAGVARGTTAGTNRLDIFDGTAPAGTLTNGCSIYSASGELWAMDAAGIANKISKPCKLWTSGGATESVAVDAAGITTMRELIVNGGVNPAIITLGAAGLYDGAINTPHSLYINIDSNNDGTAENFIVAKNGVGRGSTDGGVELFRIAESGIVTAALYGAGTATFSASGVISSVSDERLKDIQGLMKEGLGAVMALNPILYKWNDQAGMGNDDTTYIGFSAQEVQKLIPDAIGMDSRGYLSLSDRGIIAALVNAVKEQQVQIEALQARLN